MKTSILVVTLICFCQVFFGNVENKCTAPDSVPEVNFPDLFQETWFSYKFTVEANYNELKSTMYMTEYYDKVLARGRLDIKYKGEDTKILYFNETNEVFVVTDDACETRNLTDWFTSVKNDDKLAWRWNWGELNTAQPVIGPSSMLRDIYIAWTTGAKIGKQKEAQIIRGITTNVWIYCYEKNNNEIETKIYFTEKQDITGNKKISVPVRITSSGTWDGQRVDHTFEFVGQSSFLANEKEIFALPVTLGCKRLVEDERTVPSYEGKDLYVEAEVVYRSTVNSSIYTYVSVLTMAIDSDSRHVAYHMTPWKSGSNAGMMTPGDNMFKIYDLKSKYVYVIDQSTGICEIKQLIGDQPNIILPDKQVISLLNPDIFISDQALTDFHYLGEGEERGYDAIIFEKTADSDDSVGENIITRYHLADDINMNNGFKEENPPLKVTYWGIDAPGISENQFVGKLEVNYFAFQSHLKDKNKKFDVTSCFTETGQSKWFQIIYPMDSKSASDVIPLIPSIQEAFFETVVQVVADSPLRIPRVQVDVDADNVYVTGLLLERPSPLMKYEMVEDRAIKYVPKQARQIFVSSVDICAKQCLVFGNCRSFSYCGAICTFPESNFNATEDAKGGCKLYKETNVADNLKTMDELSDGITRSIAVSNILKITVNSASGIPLEFEASLYKDGFAFGLDGSLNTIDDSSDEQLEVYRQGFKMNPLEAAESGISLGKRSQVSCQKTCFQSPTCESLSYCMVTSECFHSNLHGDQLPNSFITEDSQCQILSRIYTAHFERFPGISLGRSAEQTFTLSLEACAKKCLTLTEFDCLSFDSCPNAEDNGPTCLLHKVQVGDKNEPQNFDIAKEGPCGHYSRKLLHNFEKFDYKELVAESEMESVDTSAEGCAKLCVSDNTCKGFNFCVDPSSSSTTCDLKKTGSRTMKDSKTCSAFTKNANK